MVSSSYDHVETLGVGGSEDNREFFSTDGSSVAGGFQAGVQQQFDQFVLGVEGFYTFLDAKDSSQTDLNKEADPVGQSDGHHPGGAV